MTGFAAWGDEARFLRSTGSSVYLLSAVIADPEPEAVADLRDAMRAIRLPAEKKIHWHRSSGRRRDEVIEVVAALPLELLVVVRAGSTAERDERQRRKTFLPYMVELDALGCGSLTLESRGDHLDRRDLAMLASMWAAKVIASDLHLDHLRGPADPMLWIADAVCGAVVAARQGDERWWKRIERQTTVRDVVAG